MTTRYHGFLVTLKEPWRENDAEILMAAILLMKGVLTVEPIAAGQAIEPLAEMMIAERIDSHWRKALYDLSRNGPARESLD